MLDVVYTGAGPDTVNVSGMFDAVEAGTQGSATTAFVNLSGSFTTFVDGPNTYNDTIAGFSTSSFDKIHLTGTDTVTTAVQVNGGADTLITLSDSSTILLKGVSHIDSSFFG
jgi:hypothetical protein